MNKIIKKLIILFIIVCTISTVSLAGNNITNENGKGTVTVENSSNPYGTEKNPYQLVLGEPLIDLYYAEEDQKDTLLTKDQYMSFEFVSGKYNAAVYMVDHNSSKRRVRFTLIGTEDLRVSSVKGINYLQAGGTTYVPDFIEKTNTSLIKERLELQKPFYNINSKETFLGRCVDSPTFNKNGEIIKQELINTTDLGNGYLTPTENTYASNVSTYATLYVFSKSNLPFKEAYNITQEQIGSRTNLFLKNPEESYVDYTSYGVLKGEEEIAIEYRKSAKGEVPDAVHLYTDLENVKVVYSFSSTSSEIMNAENEVAAVGAGEAIISKIFIAIGDVAVSIFGVGDVEIEDDGEKSLFKINPVVTVDSLVFNEFPNTIVDFWGNIGYTNKNAKEVIDFWFDVFKAWAIILYIILLIYIGIKTILLSGTAEQKKVKPMLEGWLTGLLIMMFMPFLFKYLIIINDTVVDIIRVNSKYSVHAYYSFNEMFEKWGQEEGEDSKTTVIEKLYKAQEELEKEIEELEVKKEKLEQNVEAQKNILESLLSDDEESSYELLNKQNIDTALGIIENYLKDYNAQILNNGTVMSVENIETEMIQLANNFWSIEENKDRFLNSDLSDAANLDSLYIAEVEKYFNNLEINVQDAANLEEAKKDLGTWIKALGGHIANRECMELLLQRTENRSSVVLEELTNTQNDLQNVEIAIDKLEHGELDIMSKMRTEAGNTGKFIYVAIWLVLVAQVIILLILYYKRLFMLMVLLAIFPLITVAYAYEKAKGGNSNIFKNWIQEYVVNVFIQTIHAILYVTLVETGYAVYIADDQAWLIYILAIVALITTEPVFKNILGLKASTVVDLTNYGKTALGATAGITALFGTFIHTKKDMENVDKKGKNIEAAKNKKHEKEDKKLGTLRQHRDNNINKMDNLSAKEKADLLKEKHKKDEQFDKRKEWLRKKNKQRRMNQRRLQKRAMLLKNLSGTLGTVAGGLAAGGGIDDFSTAAAVANIFTGTNGFVTLTDDAKNLNENSQNETPDNTPEVGSASPNEGAENNINYAGGSYDDYGYNGGASEEPINMGGGKSVTAQRYAEMLRKEKNYALNVKNNIEVVEKSKN